MYVCMYVFFKDISRYKTLSESKVVPDCSPAMAEVDGVFLTLLSRRFWYRRGGEGEGGGGGRSVCQ